MILLSSCNLNNTVYGWYIDNQSFQNIDIFFNDSKISVDANTVAYFDNIDENATVSISDSYHINYEISYKYSTATHNSKKLIIKDKTKYSYVIKNNYTDIITFSCDNNSIDIAAGDTKEIVTYDSPLTFKVLSNNFEIPYTENIVNNIIYIFVDKN